MVVEKILLGISLSAPLGPVSVEMIKRGFQRGFLGAFIVRLGGALGQTLCLIAAYFGLSFIASSTTLTSLISLFGSCVLMYLGLKSLFNKKSFSIEKEQSDPTYNVINGLLTGFILALANPVSIVFWFGIFAATMDNTSDAKTWSELLQNLSIILGVLIWGAFLSCLLEIGKKFFTPKLIRCVTLLAGVMLLYLGTKFADKAIFLLRTA